jgi:hypothetical protein
VGGKLARHFELAEIQVSEIASGFVLSDCTCDAKTVGGQMTLKRA